MKTLVTVAALLLACASIQAGEYGFPDMNACFYGFVRGPKNTPVAHARISFTGNGISGVRVVYSDEAGRFCAVLPRGYLFIVADAPRLATAPYPGALLTVDRGFRVPLLLEVSPVEQSRYVLDQQLLAASMSNLRRCPCSDDLTALEQLPKSEP